MKGIQRRVSAVAAVAALALAAGCVDSGLPGKNMPLEEAESRAGSYPVYAAADEAETSFEHDGEAWVVAGAPEPASATQFVVVGTAHGRSVYALVADEAPYDRLWMETENGWSPFARVE